MKKSEIIPEKLLILLFSGLVLLFFPAGPVQAQCLIQGRGYEMILDQEIFQGQAGQKVPVRLQIDPAGLPSGCFVSSTVKQIQGPVPAEITTGFPEIFITCPSPGEYKFSITTSLVIKSSCAGVSSCTFDPRTIILNID